MTYVRLVSACGTSSSDIAGEIVTALAAASLVLEKEDTAYSSNLISAAESLFGSTKSNPKHETYTSNEDCGGKVRGFYNSASHLDELAWGGTWLFQATGKFGHLKYATEILELAVKEETQSTSRVRVFDWNNKLVANAVSTANNSEVLMDGLHGFIHCEANSHKLLGENPIKMSYLVGFGDRYPTQVHHRAASIPWDGRRYSCADAKIWKESKDPNPNVLSGAMVAGPGLDDRFLDLRNQPRYTEPTIAGNTGLVAGRTS